MAFGFIKDAYDSTIGKLPKGIKDAAVLGATGGVLDSDGNVNLGGMGPGGQAVNQTVGDNLGLEMDISGNPQNPAQIPTSYANPGGSDQMVSPYAPQGPATPAGPDAGLNMMVPGAAEQYYETVAPAFTSTTQSQSQYGQYAPQLNSPTQSAGYAGTVNQTYGNRPNVTQNTQQAYRDFQANRPDLMTDPNMGAYYENAKRRAQESIAADMASRGMYGSTAAMDRSAEAVTDLEAERALREADYGLRRADLIRGFGETAGNLARGADISSEAASRSERDWMLGLGDIYATADDAELSRMGLGMDAARSADDAWLERTMGGADVAASAQDRQRRRGQDFFQNTFDLGREYSDIAGSAYGDIIAGDQALMDSAIGMELGLGNEALNQDYRQGDRFDSDFKYVTDTLLSASGYGGKGKG